MKKLICLLFALCLMFAACSSPASAESLSTGSVTGVETSASGGSERADGPEPQGDAKPLYGVMPESDPAYPIKIADAVLDKYPNPSLCKWIKAREPSGYSEEYFAPIYEALCLSMDSLATLELYDMTGPIHGQRKLGAF